MEGGNLVIVRLPSPVLSKRSLTLRFTVVTSQGASSPAGTRVIVPESGLHLFLKTVGTMLRYNLVAESE